MGATVLVQGSYWLFFALWFSKENSVRFFSFHAGLQKRLNLFGWIAAWLAIGIGFINHFGAVRGWTASSIRPAYGYQFTGGAWLFFIFKSVFVVPFYEETVTRGFLYRAFRSSYGKFFSTSLIICFSAYFHWWDVSHSAFTLLCLATLWTLLCIVREWTGNLWNCLLCHVAYNAIADKQWLVCIIGMILILPFCVFPNKNLWRKRDADF